MTEALVDTAEFQVWKTDARRDDWHTRFVGSDIRQMLAEIERLSTLCTPSADTIEEASVLASIGGWRVGCEAAQENVEIVSRAEKAGYLSTRRHFALATPDGDAAFELTVQGLKRLAAIGTDTQFRDAISMRYWYRTHSSAPDVQQRWYLGSQNDGLFIVNAKPSSSNDHPWHDRPNGPTIVLNVTELPEAKATKIVEVMNNLAAKSEPAK